MRTGIFSMAGFALTALMMTATLAPMATADSNGDGATTHVPPLAASVAQRTAVQPHAINHRNGKCGTKFGPELPTPDAIISWNDTTSDGFNEAGAADFTCARATSINKVNVWGAGGRATETFSVTFYADDPSGSLNEPNDDAVLCDYPSITASLVGDYTTRGSLVLPTPCQVPAGTSWVSVQDYDASGPWYWEMQNTQSGANGPDWRDVNDQFGTGCTTFDSGGGGEDRYLEDCLGYTYADWMVKLK